MLFLVFQLDQDRYAIEARRVTAVLRMVAPKAIPQAPAAVAGLFDYAGEPVPLIDLSQLALGRPAQARLSTRVVLVPYADGAGRNRTLGLIAEQVVETVQRDPAEFVASGVDSAEAGYLGPVASDAQGLLQWVQIERLLPASLRDLLFAATDREPA
ncbi:chemotaxis protein CheW [Lysobacter firmicutimachus]|uniref:Chemotaxis protein CheW n=1 Tax=Lysobacter firmicutimachus TaxID=1792846 RepID=A0AAU8MN33_9GAMM|nr:chemotaxis protein CheW [Lysobacter antibioticus]